MNKEEKIGELHFVSKELIEKGWSGDKKYCVTIEDGRKYLLRIVPSERCVGKEAWYENMFRMHREIAKLNLSVCESLEFGECEEGLYFLQTWVEGQDAEAVLPALAKEEQYAHGLEAGRMLQKMHTIPAPENQSDWGERFNRKTNRKIQMYRDCPVQFEGAENLIEYIEANRHLLTGRPQCFQHGDYHIGNMMVSDGKLVVIDFDRYDFGDPWEEFNRIVWCAQKAPVFARGMVDGYFDGQVPMEFWRLLAFYICSNTLSSVPWAVPYGQAQVDIMLEQAFEVLGWYDNMKNPVPTWYVSD